ncbi:NTP transferase domain-containing protein [uncultured Sharpea sp.]|uniref:NTP transferase domain-containing protein n=1 Tax=uncultured Sharpea sp. TaxID=1112738 RepID=UPI0025841FC8|nr:NTP transferase domain-containing protein [uncultured Sharpea sp.]
MFKVDNAIIMAAGTSSRFAPLSYEKPKGLVEVKGEVLVERQIRQLREAGIEDIVLITGYKAGS